MYSDKMMLNGMVDRRETSVLELNHRVLEATIPSLCHANQCVLLLPKITIMINLLTINHMATVSNSKQKIFKTVTAFTH